MSRKPSSTIPVAERRKLARLAKTRAAQTLKEKHPEEFEELFNAERERLELEPLHAVKSGRRTNGAEPVD